MSKISSLFGTISKSPSLQFAGRYRLFSLALGSTLLALGLQFAGLATAAHVILIAIAALVSLPLLHDMYQDVRHGTYGIDILAITAIVSSLLLREYWTAIIIVLMLTGGQALEDYAEHRSRRELDALLQRAPQTAHVLRGRKLMDVAASSVQAGDRIVIKPGEVVPVDAAIIEGTSSFDESSLTGESLPVAKDIGEHVLSGAVNTDGAVTCRATRRAADSQYQQIVKLVENAQNSQAPFVRLADRYSIPFTIIAFIIAGTVWYISKDPIRFLEVIVVATPCPLLLAAPIAIISGMSRASKRGIIIRTGSALERLAKVKTMAFDKTGTLTSGRLSLVDIQTFHGSSAADVLGMAAALETSSGHVLARAIQQAALERTVKIPKARHITEVSGRGMTASISGTEVIIGRKSLLDEHAIIFPPKFRTASIRQTASFVAVDGQLAGVLLFADDIRPESESTLARLHKLGIRNFEMVTGDNKLIAESVARKLGITMVTSEALPADKLLAVEAIKARPVAFVGDGVNDAPVLTASDVGIALGARGSTAASESADIVIMVDDISRVADGVAIANRTFRIARQSILIGIGLSVILMLIFATGRFQPIYGAFIQELVDIVVIFNALRAHSAGRQS